MYKMVSNAYIPCGFAAQQILAKNIPSLIAARVYFYFSTSGCFFMGMERLSRAISTMGKVAFSFSNAHAV